MKKDILFYSNFCTYCKEVLNNIYRREFQKPLLTTWLLTDPDRLVVEHKVWSPKNYNKETPVFDKDGYKYLNTYAPNKLEAVKGTQSLGTIC